MRRLLLALAFVTASAVPLTAQDFTQLLEAERYEEAVALLTDVNLETAYAGAEMLFEHVNANAFRTGAWEVAARGFDAGSEIPRLNERQRQRFDFWHATALVNLVQGDTIQPPALTNDEAIARLEEAYDLLLGSRDYAWGINQSHMVRTVGRMLEERFQAR